MRQSLPVALALGAMLAPPAAAQDQPTPVVMAVYYRCDQAREARADTIVRTVFAPVMEKHMSIGHFTAWGYTSHTMGGEWRRLLYTIGTDRDAMMDARAEAIRELSSGRNAAATRELGNICPSHDDYLWTLVAGSQPSATVAQQRPAAGASTYYVCEVSREALADEMVRGLFAPILNRHVQAGHINSWSWLAHRAGGKFRRLLVYDGASPKALLTAGDRMLADINREYPAAGRAFSEICSEHEDYLWNITHARP